MLFSAFSYFFLEGLQLLAEALPPPEENLGAGETAEEGGVVIYPVETIRERSAPSAPPPRPASPPHLGRLPHLVGVPTPPPPAGGSLDSFLCCAYLTLTACISLQAEQSSDSIVLPACQPLASQTRTIST